MDSVNKLRQELRVKMVALRNALQIEQPHLEGDLLHDVLIDNVHDVLSFIDEPSIYEAD